LKAGRDKSDNQAGLFRTTRWSLILSSISIQAPESRAALAELCKLYWYPLYAFARRSGFESSDAEDLTQSFFLHLLEKKALDCATPLKGRFRSFLLASFKNYMSVARHRNHAAKRGGNIQTISLDAMDREFSHELESNAGVSAETIFDARWASTLLERAQARLREEYFQHGRGNSFDRLKIFLTDAEAGSANAYEMAAEQLGLTIAGIKTLVFRLRKRFSALVRDEVAQTVRDPSEIDAELHSLCEALLSAQSHASE
jgi:DNA-directed RNA polymerase specialized sigma24 family protein